jgi:hypothetical protein
MVKIRRFGSFKGAKYVEAYRDRPGIYPDPAAIKPGKPLVVCEGNSTRCSWPKSLPTWRAL